MFKCFKKPKGKQSFYIPRIKPTVGSFSEFENEVMVLINDYRVSKGLNPLSINHFSLLDIARSHTRYMVEVDKCSHDNFPIRNGQAVKYLKATWFGECTAYGYGTPAGFVKGWVTSDGHREILEKLNARTMAVSIEMNNKSRNYGTLNLIN